MTTFWPKKGSIYGPLLRVTVDKKGSKMGPDFDQKWVIFNIDSLLEKGRPTPFKGNFI